MKKMVFISIILAFSINLFNCATTSTEVRGNFYEASKENSPGVILLHGWRGSVEGWEYLSKLLKNQGYSIFAPDLPQGSEYEMLRKVDECFQYLLGKKVDPNRIALIGESTGANLALLYGAKNPKVKTIVLLSPGFDFRLPLSNPKHELKKYGDRPIMVIASYGDRYIQSPKDSEQLFKWATGKKELKWAPRGHGIGMFDREVFDWILSWLRETL